MNKTQHLLTILAEECAEVAQVACKAIRFGLDSTNLGRNPEDNKRLLERELADLMTLADLLGLKVRDEDKTLKRAKVKKFMGYSRRLGLLEKRSI